MDKKELIERLKQLDDEASMILPKGEKLSMTIIGGSALILSNYLTRATVDIDVIDRYPLLQPVMEKYDVNNRSNAFIDCVAESYNSRMTKLVIETKAIDYYVMSLEDLIIMKLHSNREKDYQDISNPEIVSCVDWNLLDSIVNSGEVDVSFNKQKYELFLEKYNKYKEKFQK